MHSSQQLVCMLLSCHAVSFRQSLLSLSPVRFAQKGAVARDLLWSKALLLEVQRHRHDSHGPKLKV